MNGFNSSQDFDSTQAGDQTVRDRAGVVVTVNAGEGNDIVTGNNIEFASFISNGEGGNDTLSIGRTLDGGIGDDTLTVTGTLTGATITGGGGNDSASVTQRGNIVDDIIIEENGGVVEITDAAGAISSVSTVETLTVDTGNQNDIINAVPLTNVALTVIGGAGTDVLNVDTACLPTTRNATSVTVAGRQPLTFNATTETVNVASSLTASESSLSVNESASSVIVTVTRTVDTSRTVTVVYSTSDRTATAGVDYTATSGTLTFNVGETTKTFAVPFFNDTADEPDETFSVTLGDTTGIATVCSAPQVFTIVDDDVTPTLFVNDVTVIEGNNGTNTALFTVTLSAGSGRPVTVEYTTANVTATAGSDYTAVSGTLTFAPGVSTQTISITLLADSLDEVDETFGFTLRNQFNATLGDGQAFGVILDDDATPTLSISDVTVAEGNSGASNAVFVVALSAASGLPVTVKYATTNGSATAGSDYSAVSGILTFAPGTTTQNVSVPIQGDQFAEQTETFTVNLSEAVNADIADAQAVGTILGGSNGDSTPALSIVLSNPLNNSMVSNLNFIYGTVIDTTGAARTLSRVDIDILNTHLGYYNGSTFVGPTTLLPANVSGNSFSLNTAIAGENAPEGIYTITVRATDTGGNQVSTAIRVLLDARAPVVRFTTPVNGSQITNLVTLAGTAIDSPRCSGINRVELYIQRASDRRYFNGTSFVENSVALTTTYTGTTGQFVRRSGLPNASQLTPGRYTLVAKAFDRAGRIGRSVINVLVVSRSTTPTPVSLQNLARNTIVIMKD